MSSDARRTRPAVAGAIVLAACAALVAGCATATTRTSVTTVARAPSPPSSPNTPARPAQTPRQRAEADAAAILAAFAVPPGASKLSAAPSAGQGVLKNPFQQPMDPDLVDDASWWQAPGTPGQVLAWETAHLSHRFSAGQSGSGQDGQVVYWADGFTLPAITGVLDSRTLLVEAIAAGGGKTDLRVDAQVTWIPARPASELVPSAARAVTLSLLPNLNSGAKPPGPATITKPDQVRALAALINGLPEFPPAVYSCPAGFAGELVLTFRARPAGPALAVVTVELSGCQGVDVTIGGKPQPRLGDLAEGRPVAAQALKIAGLDWRLPSF
jgi:hypothetical protein